jgi:hypothetical protein
MKYLPILLIFSAPALLLPNPLPRLLIIIPTTYLMYRLQLYCNKHYS